MICNVALLRSPGLHTLLLLALAAIATPAQAVAMQYMEIDGGRVVLFGRCTPERNNWCDCALADETVVPDIDDSMMCWKIEGETIIFENSKYRFERPVIDLKFSPRDENNPAPPFDDLDRKAFL